jgi:hypothetical protein
MDLDPFFSDGLKILNFHPFMLATNCPDSSFYSRVRRHIPTLDAEQAKALCHDGIGERDFLLRLLNEVRRRGLKFYTLGELFEDGSGRFE